MRKLAITVKEKILLVAGESIPDELKKLPQFLLWKAEWNEERKQFDKIPYQINGKKASSTDFATWNTFEKIFDVYEGSSDYDGVGFALTHLDPFSVVDIDGLQSTDDLDQLAKEVVNMSYAEVSPSRTGLHIWFRYEYNKQRHKNKNSETGYEIYSTGRFMTITGESINDLPINEGGRQLDSFLDKVLKREQVQPKTGMQNNANYGTSTLSEEEIIRIACNSKTGGRFNSFIYGGWELAYNNDQSSADLAFLNELAFYTNCDAAIMDAMYRKSALMREKWDRPQSGSTYGNIHIQKAIAECTNTFVATNTTSNAFVFPRGYLSEYGLLYKTTEKIAKDGQVDIEKTMICRQTPIITRSYMNVEYPRLYHEIKWSDKGREYNEVVPAGDIAIKKELLKLAYKSLAVNDNNAKDLITYFDRLNMVNDSDQEYLVERLGHIKNTFIHPLRNSGIKILPGDAGEQQMLEAFQQSGTTAEWFEYVFDPIKKHPKALLMLLSSFTSVIAHDLKLQPFIVDLSGATSLGKTSVLKTCASVWGTSFLMSEWNLTKTSGERKAAFLNGFPLLLDDSRKADTKQLQSFVYNFSGGRGKGRGSIVGSQTEATWCGALLSTGESSLNEYAEQAGGVAARIIAITGVPFENVDFEFFNELYISIEKYYGSVGLEFLVKWREKKEAISHHFAEYNGAFQKKARGNEVISRIARYYAAIVFTGKLLNEFFDAGIDLTALYLLFDELNDTNKSLDKPKQTLKYILDDLDADRNAIFRTNGVAHKSIKAIYKDGTLYLLPRYLKEFLQTEQNAIRSEWLRRGMTIERENRGKKVDYQQVKISGEKFSGVALSPDIIKELDFDFSKESPK